MYRSVSGHFSRIQRGVYVDPRYDPGTYDSYCARSRNERSLHDLPLLDPARSLIRRYSDLLIANNAPHTGPYLRPHIDMTTFPSMRKSTSRVENGRYVARPGERETRNWRTDSDPCGTLRSHRDFGTCYLVKGSVLIPLVRLIPARGIIILPERFMYVDDYAF